MKYVYAVMLIICLMWILGEKTKQEYVMTYQNRYITNKAKMNLDRTLEQIKIDRIERGEYIE